jgi:hypothetical protein
MVQAGLHGGDVDIMGELTLCETRACNRMKILAREKGDDGQGEVAVPLLFDLTRGRWTGLTVKNITAT